MGVKLYKSSEDSKAAFDDSIKRDTADSASKEPGYDPEADITRFKIVKRIPTNSGGELLILDSLPRFQKMKEAVWLKGSYIYTWTDNSGTKNMTEVETLANAFTQH